MICSDYQRMLCFYFPSWCHIISSLTLMSVTLFSNCCKKYSFTFELSLFCAVNLNFFMFADLLSDLTPTHCVATVSLSAAPGRWPLWNVWVRKHTDWVIFVWVLTLFSMRIQAGVKMSMCAFACAYVLAWHANAHVSSVCVFVGVYMGMCVATFVCQDQ